MVGPIFKEVYVVGSGASLYGFDFEKLRGKVTVTCNHAFDFVPDPTYCIFIDQAFITKEITPASFEKLQRIKSRVWTFHPEKYSGMFNGMRPTRNHTGVFGEVWNMGGNRACGLAALSFALSLKPEKVYLLGLDSKVLSESEFLECCKGNGVENPPERMVHFSEKEINHRRNTINKDTEYIFTKRAPGFDHFEKHKDKIVNLSIYSAIETFPKIAHWQHF